MLDAYQNKKIEPIKKKMVARKKKFHFPHLSKTIEAVTYDDALTLALKSKQ